MRTKISFLASAFLVMSFSITSASAWAAVWYVDRDNAAGPWDGTIWQKAFQTIQEGIDTAYAAGGGEVWVAEGTYTATTDPVVTMRVGVHIYGGFAGSEGTRDQRNWNTHVTTIDGEDIRRGVLGANNATLDGFVVTRGFNHVDGGASMLNLSSPTVANCMFINNNGHGMLNHGDPVPVAPIITNCTFAGASDHGLVSDYNAAPVVLNCTFYANAEAILSNAGAVTQATNCLIFGNSGQGGVVSVNGAAVTLMNCTIAANAMAGVVTGTPWPAGSASLTNCIVWGNAEGIRGGATAAYSDIQGGYSGTGNKNADPRFADAANDDYHLQTDSPCIDTGTEAGAPDTDVDGTPRPQGLGFDVGAYEYSGGGGGEGEGEGEGEAQVPVYAWPVLAVLMALGACVVRRRVRRRA